MKSSPVSTPGDIQIRPYSLKNQKRAKTRVACELCRLRKRKCDGRRPICTPCSKSSSRKGVRKPSDCRYREEESPKQVQPSRGTLPLATPLEPNSPSNDVLGAISTKLSSLSSLIHANSTLNSSEDERSIHASITNHCSEIIHVTLREIADSLKGLESGHADELSDTLPHVTKAGLELPQQQHHLGYWDRSVERVLRWPIFDGKHASLNIRQLMERDNSHLLSSVLEHQLRSSTGRAVEARPSYPFEKYLLELEPAVIDGLEKWTTDYIFNVHTLGNLFVDIILLRKTVLVIKQKYHVFLGTGTSFLYQYFPENEKLCENEDIGEGEGYVPIYIVLIACAISILSSQYNPKNSKYGQFGSSLKERCENSKDQLAYKLFLFSREFKGLRDLSKEWGASGPVFYSLWDIQYCLLLLMYKNFMMKPIDAWHHMYEALLRMLVYLETKGGLVTPEARNYQLIQRMYWQCHKNECEFKLYLLPVYMLSGIIGYTPPFKMSDLKIPAYLSNENPIVRDGWAFYLTEVFVRPILNKILNLFFLKSTTEEPNGDLIERRWRSLTQEVFVETIKTTLKETGHLLTIFEKFLNQQNLSTPLRCADERVVRIKENLCVPVLYYVSTVVALPMPNYTPKQNEHPIHYLKHLHPYLISFFKDLCDQCLRFPDLVEFASERRHGSWYRLRDIYLSTLVLMVIYKRFGIYFFEKRRLKAHVENACKVLTYWLAECNEVKQFLSVLEAVYKDLPFIDE